MKGYGLSALAPLATVHPSPLSGGTGDPRVPGRGRKAIATANLQIELLSSIPKTCLKVLKSFLNFCFSRVSNMLMSVLNARSSEKSCKKTFLQRQIKTAIRKSSNWGNFLKRLEKMYPVYEKDLCVRKEIEELPPLPECPTAALISEFVAQLEELMGRMTPRWQTEPHLWLVRKISTGTRDNCRETSERKARTHSYDDLVDLMIELAMERENDSHMDKYLREHLRRETSAEKSPGGRSPQPHSNPGKGRGGQLKHMTER